MFLRTVHGFMVLVLLGAGAAGCKKEVKVAGPTDVEVAEAVKQDVKVEREWVGSMDGSVNAVIMVGPETQSILVDLIERLPDDSRSTAPWLIITSGTAAAAPRPFWITDSC